MAFVFLLIFFFISSGEMFCVKLSTSAKTGIFPVLTIHEAEEKKLRPVTIISDLAGKFNDFIATSRAAVPLHIAIEYLLPIKFENLFSNNFPFFLLYNLFYLI